MELMKEGCLICLTLALGWALAAYVRNREIKQMKDAMKNGNSFSFLYYDINELEHSYQVNLPRVTVVMPLKGFGEHNLHNRRSQITSLYGGPLQFLFVVESTEDPSYHAMISEFEDDVDAKVIVAGLSTTCSQKIHNQLVGVEKMHKTASMYCFWMTTLRYILDQLEHSLVRWKRTLRYLFKLDTLLICHLEVYGVTVSMNIICEAKDLLG